MNAALRNKRICHEMIFHFEAAFLFKRIVWLFQND